MAMRTRMLSAARMVVFCLTGLLATTASAQDKLPRSGLQEPVYRVAERPDDAATGDQIAAVTTSAIGEVIPGEHPLMPAVRWARQSLEGFESIDDYSAVMIKRERIDGVLSEIEKMEIKVRHSPFSVYTHFRAPQRLAGQEAIYVEGQNDGKLLAHPTGIKQKLVGTVSLLPTSPLAMTGSRYPITELGLKRLTARLIEVGEKDSQFGECDVRYMPGAKMDGRSCTCIEVTHPVKRNNFIFHKARIFVDDELNIPIRYESYDWPSQAGGKPVLMEEYTYVNIRLNNGFTNADFDIRNPSYRFK